MLVFALLATLIPSVTTGWISYLQNERSLSAKITGELQSVSAQTAREVDLWVKERLYELRVFASSYEVSENLERIQRPGGERAHERLTGYLRSVRERFADYQELFVVNPEGQEVASTAPQPTSVSLPQGWAQTIRQENAVVGDALWDDALKKGAVVFAVPIYQTGGRFLGALTAKLDFSALHRLLRRFAGGGGAGGSGVPHHRGRAPHRGLPLRSDRVDAPQPARRRRPPHARSGGNDARLPRARGRGGGGDHEGGAAARLGSVGGGPRERSLPPGDAAPQRDRADRGGPACRRGSVRLLPRAPDHAAARPPHPGRGASGERRPRRALARGRRRRAEVRDRGVQRHGCPAAREPAWARAALRHRRSHRPV